jgi:mycothione reductase
VKEYDLVIVGAGSGNMIPSPEHDDWKIAIVEKGKFGGTCLNTGCIPSKMLLQSAQVADTVNGARNFGVDAKLNKVDWKRVTGRVWDRIDPISAGGEDWRGNQPNTTVYKGEGRFAGPKVIEVNGEQITGKQIVVGADSRPFIPPIPGLDEVHYHTSDTIMRLPEQPRSIIIVGGGYIGAEMAHFFGGLGTEVTLIESSDKLIRVEDDDICIRFTEIFGRHNNLLVNSTVTAVRPGEDGSGHITFGGRPQARLGPRGRGSGWS